MIPGLIGLAGSVLNAAGGGGGGSAPAPVAAPIDNTVTFAPVTFGARYLGDSAVKQAPAVIAAENRTWTKFIPWIVGGIVAVFAAVAFAATRKR